MHEEKRDDSSLKNFFQELYEQFVKVSEPLNFADFPQVVSNPFYEKNEKIQIQAFSKRVTAIAQKFLLKR